MFDTILEHTTFVAITGSLVSLALVWIWFQTGQKQVMYGAVVAVALTLVLSIIGASIETPRERLTSWLHETAAELQANNFDALVQRIHPDADPNLRSLEAQARNCEFHVASIKKIHEIEITGREPQLRARVEMNVFVEVTAFGHRQRIPRYVELTLYEVGGQWRVHGARHEEPTYGFKIHSEEEAH